MVNNVWFTYHIHRPVLYLKHIVSETGSCLRLEVEPTHLGPNSYWCRCLCPETETSSIYWAQLGRFRVKTGRIQSTKRWVLNKDRTMDNVQKCGSYINILPSSQTYGSCMVYAWVVEAFTLVMQSHFRLPTYLPTYLPTCTYSTCLAGLWSVSALPSTHPSAHLFIYYGWWPKFEICEIIIWEISMPFDAMPSSTIWRHVVW
jgi:hypothetical protein